MDTSSEMIIKLAQERGLIRSRDVVERGLQPMALTRLVRQGNLERVSRGVYALPNRSPSEHGTFAEVAIKHPKSVVCLLSALQFHSLTTQTPFEVWIAVGNRDRAPTMDYPPLRVVKFADHLLIEGVDTHEIDDVNVQITNVARTVADCFKFRNKIGLDVALEALQESWREKRVTIDELWHFATLCRVANVMRPYMESLP
ncbi:MAG: type IV toxin-antitoxin system AbiEi family antitoxin domain-containing protein [bacterium]